MERGLALLQSSKYRLRRNLNTLSVRIKHHWLLVFLYDFFVIYFRLWINFRQIIECILIFKLLRILYFSIIIKWNRRKLKSRSSLALKSMSSLNLWSITLSRKDLLILSTLPSIGWKLMLKNTPSKMTQILKMKKKRPLLNSRPRSKRRNFRGNHKAEWESHRKPLETSIRNNLLFFQKFPRVLKLNSWSSLWSETPSFSKTLTGKMKRPWSKPWQKGNSKVVRPLSRRDKMEMSSLLLRADNTNASKWLMERKLISRVIRRERPSESLHWCTMLLVLPASDAKLLERFILWAELLSIRLSKRLFSKRETFSRTSSIL